MKNLKKIITLIAGTAALSAMAVTASADYSPAGVDMLEPGSYALSQGDGLDLYLRVTY
ncbi:MAG: hypothetical protein HDT44_11510 [Ruminococcaceae bacterium]|nr:hypothetical protein [Oscillospiraceae bacterium]